MNRSRVNEALIRLPGMAAGLLITLFAVASETPVTDELLQQRLEAHVRFLASDRLRGRQPGTDGYDIAADYVASQFRQLGLRPAGSAGDYRQPVPLRRAYQEAGSAKFVRHGPAGDRAFNFVEEFFIGPNRAHTRSSVTAPLVFVGYGITAPELGHDDYEGIDAKGKIVVRLGGQPHDFPSEEGAHFASGRERLKAALANGAVGVISIYTPRNESRFDWSRLQDRVGAPSMGWLDNQGEVFGSPSQLQVSAVVHYTPAAELFSDAPHSLEALLALDEAAAPLPAFELEGTVTLAQASRHERITSPNVAAVLPGTDPLLSDEFVVYTAHLDHIGEIPGTGHEDAINNGALDNATGVSVMLETARLFAERQPPRRSVLFLAVTAEEKGLVGSEYFAHNPTVPIESLVGVINLDMPLLLYDFADVIAFGASHSTLGGVVDAAAREAGVALAPDPFPEQNVFTRSDHYRFVQRGIPSIFLVTGMTARDGSDTQPLFEGFLAEHYHRPSDDLDQPIRYDAAARFTRINARIGERVANETERPRWHEGDFFGETFSP